MAGIDETLTFKPVTVAVLTVSDTRTRDNDTSGDILQSRIEEAGHKVLGREIVRDTIEGVQAQLQSWIDDAQIDVIISTGGTGLTGRDITVEAVTPLFDKVIDGFSVVVLSSEPKLDEESIVVGKFSSNCVSVEELGIMIVKFLF